MTVFYIIKRTSHGVNHTGSYVGSGGVLFKQDLGLIKSLNFLQMRF